MPDRKPGFVLVCDESGAKGYSDKPERHVGEFGVVAGFLLPEEEVDAVRVWAASIASSFHEPPAKIHITDLDPHDQSRLRDQVYSYLRNRRIPCVFEAMYSDGLHAHWRWRSERLAAAKGAAKALGMAIPENPGKECLHVQLMLGAFASACDFAQQHCCGPFSIKILTDRVDQSVIEAFREEVGVLLGPLSIVGSHPVFNTQTKQREDKRFEVQVTCGGAPLEFVDIACACEVEVSPLTLIADVIANSLWYHLRARAVTGAPLMSEDAIAGYPLELMLYRAPLPGGVAFADAFYPHAKERTRRAD